MNYTSAQANKRLKKLTDAYVSLREKESRSREFRAAAGENVEAVRPAYDYADTQRRLVELERCIAASSTPSTCSTQPIPYPAST